MAILLPQSVPEPSELESPLPGGVAAVVRWFFSVPQWIQIGGIVLAVVLGVVLLVTVWRGRRRLLAWGRSRSAALKAGIAGAAVALVFAALAAGSAGLEYVEHDNDFCTGCHVMSSAYTRFTGSEHAELECHDCHIQPLTASLRELYLWIVERPEEIGPHAPVPSSVCADCHVREEPDTAWERIASTAGHRVHLESDSSALDDVACVTCHGIEVHRFVPADSTCGQSGCHREEDTRIVLGSMAASRTTFHCLTCHEFTAPLAARGPGAPDRERRLVEDPHADESDPAAVPETPDEEARILLGPRMANCSSCHEMRPLMADIVPADDPHGGECGLCHDPHDQTDTEETVRACTAAGCHAEPAELTPFHRGLESTVLDDCTACHDAHDFVVRGEECWRCHLPADLP